MEIERNFWVVGGDRRQLELAKLLENDGHTVHTAALGPGAKQELEQDASRAHCIILPLPVTTAEGLLHTPLSQKQYRLEEVLDVLHPGQLICGGIPSAEVKRQMDVRGLQLCDYYAREECMIANAVPTAEGALQIAMEAMSTTLHGSRVLVIGFGRVGKLTAHRLNALGARVTVAARKCEDLAWAQAYGYDTENSVRLSYWLGGYDLIINTVPAMMLDELHLEWIQPEAFLIDLASLPGGIDLEAASRLDLRAVRIGGIPGRSAPVTAAKAIRDSIYNILNEVEGKG
ncbi:MAG: dipicolinate synthase subunit DpsA [Evtepia sp.]